MEGGEAHIDSQRRVVDLLVEMIECADFVVLNKTDRVPEVLSFFLFFSIFSCCPQKDGQGAWGAEFLIIFFILLSQYVFFLGSSCPQPDWQGKLRCWVFKTEYCEVVLLWGWFVTCLFCYLFVLLLVCFVTDLRSARGIGLFDIYSISSISIPSFQHLFHLFNVQKVKEGSGIRDTQRHNNLRSKRDQEYVIHRDITLGYAET